MYRSIGPHLVEQILIRVLTGIVRYGHLGPDFNFIPFVYVQDRAVRFCLGT